MLELQRASAGSGKTYALARTFIWYYITIRESDQPGALRRLRTLEELTDSLSHILAVTFTNKATNEMQQRIVEKLYALGAWKPGEKHPDYMKDFLKSLRKVDPEVTEKDISYICSHGVEILLNHYSDFHVSTIDSFFQQVLRTFAYESDLNDSYRIELDDDFLSTVAIDAVLEDINSHNESKETSYWVSELMRLAGAEGKRWNIFAKSGAGDNPYSTLADSVKRLQNEEFKKIRAKLDKYFDSNPDLCGIYEDLRERYETKVDIAHRDMMRAARALQRALQGTASTIEGTDMKAFRSRIKKVAGTKALSIPKEEDAITGEIKKTDAYMKRRTKGDTAAYEEAERLDGIMTEAAILWYDAVGSSEFRHWNAYRKNIPFLGLMQAIRKKREEYLRENNAIELGETNSMLHSIIGGDDVPFIYERLGTRINHYLIDEFQDTSQMQWDNMQPLLRESIGRGEENLIIGDAKQSIYRFRNADSSLISETVPKEFGLSMGADESNTNWRSDLRVIQFNNTFFSGMVAKLNNLVGVDADPNRKDFMRDYGNVVQNPSHRKERGYVELRLRPARSDRQQELLERLPVLICDLQKRGFRQGDIAILVNRHTEGEEIIKMFTDYNARPDKETTIEFVSEQSLKIGSSVAVMQVVDVLDTICRGADPEIREGEDRKGRGVADWAEVSCNYKLFALRHPELNTPDCLREFFATGGDNDSLGKMLQKMEAVSLPALVESIIAEFIEEEVRKNDAVFLSAFQDLVLEYCEGKASDIGSFLKWWEEKKDRASIASPEGHNAVQIMTVHKSKGLEFPVVIVPYATYNFTDSSTQSEWRWVVPEGIKSEAGALPDYVPVATERSLEGTAHEALYYQFHDQKKNDSLNSFYVAFTRAVAELYIFAEIPKNTSGTEMSALMKGLFTDLENKLTPAGIEYMDSSAVQHPEEELYCYGTKYRNYAVESKEDKAPEEKSKKVEEEAAAAADSEKKSEEDWHLNDYRARKTPEFIAYRVEGDPDNDDEKDVDPLNEDEEHGESRTLFPELEDAPEQDQADDREEEESDARSEGEVLHAIMEQIKTREDIPRAVRRSVIQGLIPYAAAKEIESFLYEKTMLPEVERWFSGGMKVIAERSLICRGKKSLRPDRIMVDSSGRAIVIDYKFGESLASHAEYVTQVREYMWALKSTGLFKRVEGWLWYVRLNKVERIPLWISPDRRGRGAMKKANGAEK